MKKIWGFFKWEQYGGKHTRAVAKWRNDPWWLIIIDNIIIGSIFVIKVHIGLNCSVRTSMGPRYEFTNGIMEIPFNNFNSHLSSNDCNDENFAHPMTARGMYRNYYLIWWFFLIEVIHIFTRLMSPFYEPMIWFFQLCTQPFVQKQIKENIKLRVTGICEGNSPLTGELPAQRVSDAENSSIWWRHHEWVPVYGHHRPKTHKGVWASTGIYSDAVNYPHKGPVTRKIVPFYNVIMSGSQYMAINVPNRLRVYGHQQAYTAIPTIN